MPQAIRSPMKNIALLGGQGRLGAWILKALQEYVDAESGFRFHVSVLRRHDTLSVFSKEDYPGLSMIELPHDYINDHDGCVKSLRGQDALVIAIPGGKVKEQIALARACVDAGVRRMIPANYGSLDSEDAVVLELAPIFKHKQEVRRFLESLTQSSRDSHDGHGHHEGSSFSWTSIVCGHFFDYALESPRMLQYDLKARVATIFDTGDEVWSACMRTRVGHAVARILSPSHDPGGRTRNRIIYIQSFTVTQNRILDALKQVSGTDAWTVIHGKGDEWIEEKFRETKVAAEKGDEEAFWLSTEELVGVLGMRRANWVEKADFVNELLGFEEEDLVEAVRESWNKRQQELE